MKDAEERLAAGAGSGSWKARGGSAAANGELSWTTEGTEAQSEFTELVMRMTEPVWFGRDCPPRSMPK